jgi:hypothetical protein
MGDLDEARSSAVKERTKQSALEATRLALEAVRACELHWHDFDPFDGEDRVTSKMCEVRASLAGDALEKIFEEYGVAHRVPSVT